MTPRLLKNSFWPADEPIQRIPPSLNLVYEKIIDRVSSEQVHTVRKLIQDHCCSTASLNNTKKKEEKKDMALGIAIHPESRTTAQAE